MANIKPGILVRFSAPICKLALSLCAALGIASAAQAENYAWSGAGADTNYSTPANWGSESAYPGTGTGDGAMFIGDAASKTVTFDGTYSLDWVWVATGDVLTPVTWVASSDANGMTVAGNIGVADNDGTQTGALSISSGTYSAAKVVVGNTFGNNGLLTMTGGSLSATNVMDFANGEGSIVLDGGNLTIAKGMTWCWSEAGAGHASLSISNGGKLTVSGSFDNTTTALNAMWGGPGHKIDINVANGTFEAPQGDLYFGTYGSWADAYPNGNVTGYVKIDIGEDGVFSCGSATAARTLMLGQFGSEPMTVNVNGGTLAVGRITRGGNGAANVNVNGGTLAVNGTYEDGVFLTDSGIVYTVGSNGATLNTNGKEITIAATIGGTGTLNIVGGGKVTFTAEPTCTVSSSDDTSFVRPSDTPVVENAYYWVGGAVGENSRLAFSATAGKWSLSDGGEPIADFVPGEGDTAVFTSAGVNLYANNVAANIRALADVSFYNHDTKNNYVMSGDLYVESGFTVTLKAIKGAHVLTLSGALKGSGTLRAYAESMSCTVNINGDTSAFAGDVKFVVGGNNTLASCRIGNAAAANNALSSWNVFLTENSIVPYRDSTRTGYTAFPLSDTTYRFGALNAVVSYPDNAPANSTFVIGGRDNEDSSVYGQFLSGGNTIVWNADSAVNPDVTYTHGVINCAGLTVTGGGIVKFTAANAFPAAFTLSNKGAYLGMTTDADFNAAVAAAVTTVDADAPVGFYSSESEETSVNLLSAKALVGKTLCKRGAGTVYVTNLPASGVNDIVVSEGTLVLPHGVVVGDVTVAQGASLLVDLIGAEDNEVVFAFGSISGEGDVAYRNKASIGEVVVDDTENTWTFRVTGTSRTFTWIGAEGASWNDSANWLADGEPTGDIPSAIDTVQFNESAMISASGTLAGDVRIAAGVTLTIPAGLTFSKLTAASGAAIVFSSTSIATVGGALTLLTVGEASGVAAALNLPSTYGVSVDAGTGAITATRNAGIYTWTGSVDNNWATGGNWSVNGSAVAEVPAAEDSVVFPTSDADGFEGWSVSLPWDVYAETVTLNADVTLGGARTLKAQTINGAAELKLNNAHLGCNGQDIVVNCPLNILPGTTDYIYLSGYNATLNGALYGSGKLISDANNVQNKGVTFNGEVSEFYGEFEATRFNNRDHTDMSRDLYGSEHAVWRTEPSAGGKDGPKAEYIIHSNDTLYKFGAYIGGFWVGYLNPQIEVGARDDVDSSFRLDSYGGRSKYTITKVGNGVMTITNGKGDTQIGTLNVNGGTSIIRTIPDKITFGGGALRTPIYSTVIGTETKFVYVNATDDTDVKELDEDRGTSFVENEIEYVYKETKVVDVNGPYYPDVSGAIKDSTDPIWFDTGDAGYTWASDLDYSNKGGFIKDGTGTLTLSGAYYQGPTWIKDGKIVFPEGTDVTLDPRSVGVAENARVDGYKYMANTVLYGNEPGSDVEGDVDVSGVVKIDISNSSFVDALVDDRVVVLCRTAGRITGRDSKKFVQGETLLVPEKPEDVPEKRWNWMVRVMQIGGKNCLCVALRTMPFSIKLR